MDETWRALLIYAETPDFWGLCCKGGTTYRDLTGRAPVIGYQFGEMVGSSHELISISCDRSDK